MATYTPRMVVRRTTRKLAQTEGRPMQGRPKVARKPLVVATDLVTTEYRTGYATYLGTGPTPTYPSEPVQRPSTTDLNATPNAPIDK